VTKELDLGNRKHTLRQTHSETVKMAELKNFPEMNHIREVRTEN